MDQKSEAEELLRALTQLTHHPELEPTEQLARGEGALLWYLAKGHDGATAGALREVLAVGSGRVANVLKSLEAKELITRVPSDADGRVVQVYLTHAGRNYILERHNHLVNWTMRLMEELGEEDSRQTLHMLRKLLQASDRIRQKSR